MSRLIDVAAVLERMAETLAGTEQGEACAFAVRLMRERESATDTERLHWLLENTIIAGPDGHVIDCVSEVDDAMRGGAK